MTASKCGKSKKVRYDLQTILSLGIKGLITRFHLQSLISPITRDSLEMKVTWYHLISSRLIYLLFCGVSADITNETSPCLIFIFRKYTKSILIQNKMNYLPENTMISTIKDIPFAMITISV